MNNNYKIGNKEKKQKEEFILKRIIQQMIADILSVINPFHSCRIFKHKLLADLKNREATQDFTKQADEVFNHEDHRRLRIAIMQAADYNQKPVL